MAYPGLLQDVEPGNLILLADGAVQLRAVEVGSSSIFCEVLAGGAISSHKGVNLPLSRLRISAFTEKDRAALAVGLEEHVDFVALSFVREVEDLQPVLDVLRGVPHPPLLIAKIEKHEALDSIDTIVAEVDGIMVARGDLGVEIPLERVPLVQKMLIGKANRAGKPVITATQMLRSMVDSPRPTRAEVTDVANAILDGTDAVMLSDETAMGAYPIEAVKMMARIADDAETGFRMGPRMLGRGSSEVPHAARGGGQRGLRPRGRLERLHNPGQPQSGQPHARAWWRNPPRAVILAATAQESIYRRLALIWGVAPVLVEKTSDAEEMMAAARRRASEKGVGRSGDTHRPDGRSPDRGGRDDQSDEGDGNQLLKLRGARCAIEWLVPRGAGLGTHVLEALASPAATGTLELPGPRSQAGAWERAQRAGGPAYVNVITNRST